MMTNWCILVCREKHLIQTNSRVMTDIQQNRRSLTQSFSPIRMIRQQRLILLTILLTAEGSLQSEDGEEILLSLISCSIHFSREVSERLGAGLETARVLGASSLWSLSPPRPPGRNIHRSRQNWHHGQQTYGILPGPCQRTDHTRHQTYKGRRVSDYQQIIRVPRAPVLGCPARISCSPG